MDVGQGTSGIPWDIPGVGHKYHKEKEKEETGLYTQNKS